MTLQRFIALWSHRYVKYSHIFKAHRLAYQAWVRFRLKKWQLTRQGKELIAVVRTEHFGDIVATEPLSRHIRSLYPKAYLVWFVKPVFRELVDTNPVIDETFPEFCVTQRRVLLETGIFDQVFELQFRNNNHCPVCDVFVENPTANAAGINVYTYLNFGNLLTGFAKTAGLSLPQDDQPRIYLQAMHRQKVDSLGLEEPFIVVHCQSNYTPKDWPASHWERLIQELSGRYPYKIVEVGLKSNLEISTPRYRSLCGRLSIMETAEVIGRAAYFIGLDSGPSHLASATGTFGFVLMGSLNNFENYNPYSGTYGNQQNCVLIRKEGLPCAQLPYEYVLDIIQQKLTHSLPAKA